MYEWDFWPAGKIFVKYGYWKSLVGRNSVNLRDSKEARNWEKGAKEGHGCKDEIKEKKEVTRENGKEKRYKKS
jgi:hypothetical protein